jgi:hypothetical protein
MESAEKLEMESAEKLEESAEKLEMESAEKLEMESAEKLEMGLGVESVVRCRKHSHFVPLHPIGSRRRSSFLATRIEWEGEWGEWETEWDREWEREWEQWETEWDREWEQEWDRSHSRLVQPSEKAFES